MLLFLIFSSQLYADMGLNRLVSACIENYSIEYATGYLQSHEDRMAGNRALKCRHEQLNRNIHFQLTKRYGEQEMYPHLFVSSTDLNGVRVSCHRIQQALNCFIIFNRQLGQSELLERINSRFY